MHPWSPTYDARQAGTRRLRGPSVAVRAGASLDPASLAAGLTGRCTQPSLDLARAYAMREQDAAAALEQI
jgi:hypothetical protein